MSETVYISSQLSDLAGTNAELLDKAETKIIGASDSIELPYHALVSIHLSGEAHPELEHLTLHGNKLTEFPGGVVSCEKIRSINLSLNRITKVPRTIGQCLELRSLKLRDNQINTLPEELAKCTKLEVLDLRGTPIETLPAALRHMRARILLDEGRRIRWSDGLVTDHHGFVVEEVKKMTDAPSTAAPKQTDDKALDGAGLVYWSGGMVTDETKEKPAGVGGNVPPATWKATPKQQVDETLDELSLSLANELLLRGFTGNMTQQVAHLARHGPGAKVIDQRTWEWVRKSMAMAVCDRCGYAVYDDNDPNIQPNQKHGVNLCRWCNGRLHGVPRPAEKQ